jgi:hypothetical protein
MNYGDERPGDALISKLERETQQAGEISPHPRARAFFREVAEARRWHRRMMLDLDPECELFRLATGNEDPRPGGNKPRVSSIPGEADGAVSPPAAAEADPDIGTYGPVLSGRTSGTRFGLNAMHAYEDAVWPAGTNLVRQAHKFGADDQPFEDAARLGASVVRQHGGRDLFWGMLAPMYHPPTTVDELGTPAEVPLVSGLDAAVASGLDRDGNPMSNVDRLTDLLTAAHGQGIKLVFSFLVIGDGGEPATTSPPSTRAASYDGAAVEYLASDGQPKSRIDFNGNVTGSFEDLPWSEDHLGQTSPSGVSSFPLRTGDPTSGLEAWFLDSLDPSCPYKRELIGQIASRAAQMLLDAASAASLDLADVVEGIEIFNEVGPRDCWVNGAYSPDMHASGAKWGRAYLHAAWAFRSLLTDSSVKLFMPGIASYGDATGRQWQDKLDFVDGFVHGMALEAQESEYALGSDTETVLLTLPSLLQGIDLHWYHRREGEMLHIGYLVFEIEELRQAVHNAVASHVHEIDSSAFADFPVTVFESGWGLDRSKNGFPAGVSSMKDDEMKAFQAAEVWRRIGGALAGGADIASWHCWMAATGGQFVQMGLREDSSGPTTVAAAAIPRPAWYAYSMLSDLLGDRVLSGNMVLPRVSSRAMLKSALHIDPHRTGAVVLEFRLDSDISGLAGGWAYMVLRDPAQVSTARLVASPATPTITGAERYEIDYNESLVVIGTQTELEVYSLSYSPTTVSVGGGLTVAPTWSPVLYFCSGQLVWRAVAYAGSSSTASSLYSRPGWMDDPGKPIGGDKSG